MTAVLVSVGLLVLSVLAVALVAAGKESCRLPEEPWIWWDGEDPEDLQ